MLSTGVVTLAGGRDLGMDRKQSTQSAVSVNNSQADSRSRSSLVSVTLVGHMASHSIKHFCLPILLTEEAPGYPTMSTLQ